MRWFRRGAKPAEVVRPSVECGICGALVESYGHMIAHQEFYHVDHKSWGVRVTDMDNYVVSCASLEQANEVSLELGGRGIKSKVVPL